MKLVKILFSIGLTAILSSCGTIATYKTAELSRSGRIDITAGLATHSVPVQYDFDREKLANKSFIWPEVGIWSRLFAENSKYDGGINFSIPVGAQAIVRRNILSNRNLIPEATIGLLARKFGKNTVGDPLYTTTFIDYGLPVFFSWRLPFSVESIFYTNVTPIIRYNKHVVGYGTGDPRDFNEKVNGVQYTVGVKISNVFLEYNVLPLGNKKVHSQLGIAYGF